MSAAEKTVCRLCGHEAALAFRVGDRNRGLDTAAFQYFRCEGCDSVFVADVPRDMGRYYQADGYGTGADHFVEEFIQREQAKVALVRRFAASGRLVEIGPGPGMFTRAAVGAGYEVAAIEMDAGYCRYLVDELGVEAINSDEPALELASLAPARAVVMWHVIEHLPDPWAVLEASVESLETGGVLAISSPNPQSLQFRLLGRYWAHLDAPRHLQLIPHGTLVSKLEALGASHVLTTTTDPVGLECNRLGWEYAVRRHPARRPSTATSMRLGKLATMMLKPLEIRRLQGAAYTALFIKR
jgi:2-polyprenyl-3-methyl-5-hydroxy-6-metoxy-1,4-benzoquinol methylase